MTQTRSWFGRCRLKTVCVQEITADERTSYHSDVIWLQTRDYRASRVSSSHAEIFVAACNSLSIVAVQETIDGVEQIAETMATSPGILYRSNCFCWSSLGILLFISASGSGSSGAVLAPAATTIHWRFSMTKIFTRNYRPSRKPVSARACSWLQPGWAIRPPAYCPPVVQWCASMTGWGLRMLRLRMPTVKRDGEERAVPGATRY